MDQRPNIWEILLFNNSSNSKCWHALPFRLSEPPPAYNRTGAAFENTLDRDDQLGVERCGWFIQPHIIILLVGHREE